MIRCCTLLGLLLWSLAGQTGQLIAQESKDNRMTLVCSTTQVADFARQVVGDRMQVLCVLAPGQDPHLY
ncbi:MAG: zinc ABC transporter substrate-binding protein, partial [Pirellulaceae bacterium]